MTKFDMFSAEDRNTMDEVCSAPVNLDLDITDVRTIVALGASEFLSAKYGAPNPERFKAWVDIVSKLPDENFEGEKSITLNLKEGALITGLIKEMLQYSSEAKDEEATLSEDETGRLIKVLVKLTKAMTETLESDSNIGDTVSNIFEKYEGITEEPTTKQEDNSVGYNFTKEGLDNIKNSSTTPIEIPITKDEAKIIIGLASAEAVSCAVVKGKEDASELVDRWSGVVESLPDTIEDKATVTLTLNQLGLVFKATERILETNRKLENGETEIPGVSALETEARELLIGLSDKIVKVADKALGNNNPVVTSSILAVEGDNKCAPKKASKEEKAEEYTMAALERATAELDEEAEVKVTHDDIAVIYSALMTMKAVSDVKEFEVKTEEDKLFMALHDKYLDSALKKTKYVASFNGEKAVSFTAGELSVIGNALDSVINASWNTLEKLKKDSDSPLAKVCSAEYLENTIGKLTDTYNKIMEVLNPMLEESEKKVEERKAKDNCASEPMACNTDDDPIMDKRATLTMTRNDAACIWRLLDGIVECMHDNGDEELFGSKLFAEMAEKIVNKFDRVLQWAIDNDKEDVNIKLPYGYWTMLSATLDAIYNAMLKAEDGELDADMRRLITEAKTIGGKIMYDLAQKVRQEHKA